MPRYSPQNLTYLYAPDMARLFNGSTRYLVSTKTLAAIYPLTMACWFYATNVATEGTLMSIGDSGSSDQVCLAADGASVGDPVYARTRSGGTFMQADSTTSFLAARFNHACGVWASATSRSVYLNFGGNATDTTSGPLTTVDTWTVGVSRANGTNTNFFNGRVAWPFVWNVALADGEVRALALGTPPWLVRPEAIISAPLMMELSDPFLGALWTNTAGSLLIAPHANRLRVPRLYKAGMAVAAAGGGGTSIAPQAFQHMQRMRKRAAA